MKTTFTLILFALITFSLNAQKHELGVSLGASGFVGDLGGSNKIGTPFISDIEPKLTRPAGGLFYRYNINYRWALKTSLLATQVRGDDRLTDADRFEPAWFREHRNLHFKSLIIDATASIEFNILKYRIGDMRNRFTPYLGLGIGAFYFNPKAEYEGNWVALQPLGTEGQSLPGYKKKYLRIQPNAALSVGVKYNLNRNLAIGAEVTHRFTRTDYIDDVSTVYADRADFYANYDVEKADLTYALSRRALEADFDDQVAHITSTGMQRGDPTDFDQYFFVLVNLSYNIGSGKHSYACPAGTKNKL